MSQIRPDMSRSDPPSGRSSHRPCTTWCGGGVFFASVTTSHRVPLMDELEHAQAEVSDTFADYERALIANDIERMDAWFWDDDRVVRFGVAERQVGFEAVRRWRATAPAVPASRRLLEQHVLALTPDVVCVDVVFESDEHVGHGRQSQVWQRFDNGWRIVRAHVSTLPEDERGCTNP
jgi:Protein of unknown function (DUF3225)